MPGRIRLPARGLFRPKCGTMNQTERRYTEEVLEPLRLAGQILAWWFQPITIKLADDCRYTPDFLVMYPDGLLEIVDTKAGWLKASVLQDGTVQTKIQHHGHDESRVKMRICADKYPFRVVIAIWTKKGGWSREVFSPEDSA